MRTFTLFILGSALPWFASSALAELRVEPDKQNVVASRLEGVWQPQSGLTQRLTGDDRGAQVAAQNLKFSSDAAVAAGIPEKFRDFLGDKRIYMAGTMVMLGEKFPFVLINHSGNPHLVYFRDRDGEAMSDAESFNLTLAPAKDIGKDLLFIGGDFNNQPFRAYERVVE